MAVFRCEIRLGNAAMLTGDDIGSAMHATERKVRAGETWGNVYDRYGNKVGGFEIVEDDA